MNENLIIDSPGFNPAEFQPGWPVIVFNQAMTPIFTGIVLECEPWVLTLAIYDPNEDSGVFDRYDGDYSMRGIKPYFLKIEQVINGEIGKIALVNPKTYIKG